MTSAMAEFMLNPRTAALVNARTLAFIAMLLNKLNQNKKGEAFFSASGMDAQFHFPIESISRARFFLKTKKPYKTICY
jgi:hypothetical protein